MTEEQCKETAAQLRQPHGEHGAMTGEWMNKGNARMNADTLGVVNASANDNILEIGMGNGFFVKDILSVDGSVHYTGVDFSELMVREAERLNAEWVQSGKAIFVHSDVSSLPLDNELYDKVFTVNTVYFWEDAAKALGELKRVLKPGGKLFIGLRPKHLMVNYPFTKYGFNMFSKDDIKSLLEVNGFEVLRIIENRELDFVMGDEVMKVENMVVEAV